MNKKTLVLLVSVALMLAFVVPVLAQEGTGVTAEARANVNVRSGPGVSYAAIGQLAMGTTANVTGRSDAGNNWLQIDFDGQAGWVAFFTVVVTGNPDDLPIVQPTAETTTTEETTAEETATTEEAAPATEETTTEEEAEPAEAEEPVATLQTPATTDFFVTVSTNVNVRSGPGTGYTVIGLLVAGDTVDVTGRDSADNDWLRLDFNGMEGWVAFFAVDVTGDPDEAPIVEPGDTAEMTMTPAQEAAAERENVIVESRFRLSLRAEPTIRGERLVVIPAMTRLEPDARSENFRYLRVTYEGQTGWVVTRGVSRINGDFGTLPIAE
jgi:uncharacterized protein YraI